MVCNGIGLKPHVVRARDVSSLRAGGDLRRVYYPSTLAELAEISLMAHRENLRVFPIGNMSKILVPEEGYDGIVVSAKRMRAIELFGNDMYVGGGEKLAVAIKAASTRLLGGLETFTMVPASVGGAVYMNCGCFGREISQITKCVYVYDFEKTEFYEMLAKDLRFSYRHSALQGTERLVVGVKFALKPATGYELKNTVRAAVTERKARQPMERSLGSVFKGCDFGSAAVFIEGAGMKGYRIGGMQISEKHANFIVNRGDGTADDYLNIMKIAEKRVLDCYGIKLKREVIVLENGVASRRSSE